MLNPSNRGLVRQPTRQREHGFYRFKNLIQNGVNPLRRFRTEPDIENQLPRNGARFECQFRSRSCEILVLVLLILSGMSWFYTNPSAKLDRPEPDPSSDDDFVAARLVSQSHDKKPASSVVPTLGVLGILGAAGYYLWPTETLDGEAPLTPGNPQSPKVRESVPPEQPDLATGMSFLEWLPALCSGALLLGWSLPVLEKWYCPKPIPGDDKKDSVSSVTLSTEEVVVSNTGECTSTESSEVNIPTEVTDYDRSSTDRAPTVTDRPRETSCSPPTEPVKSEANTRAKIDTTPRQDNTNNPRVNPVPVKSLPNKWQAIESEITNRVKKKSGKTGDIQVSLSWDGRSDLDLHLRVGWWEHVWWYLSSKETLNFKLDVDDVGVSSSNHVENIYLKPAGNAGNRREMLHFRNSWHKIYVNLYKHGEYPGTHPFHVRLRVGHRTFLCSSLRTQEQAACWRENRKESLVLKFRYPFDDDRFELNLGPRVEMRCIETGRYVSTLNQCPRGDELTESTPSNVWSCSICKKKCPAGTLMYGCRKWRQFGFNCKYGLCASCRKPKLG